MKNVSLPNGQCYAGRPSERRGNFVIFSDTRTMINVKLCIIALLTELNPFISLSLTFMSLTLTQQCQTFLTEHFMFYPMKFKLYRIVKYVKEILNTSLFFLLAHVFSGDN